MQERKPPQLNKVHGRLGRAVDRAIAELFPGWSIQRSKLRQRQAVAHMQASQAVFRAAAFEAASHERLKSEKWLGSRLNPDSALLQDLETLRLRSRELYRNDDYFSGAVEKAITNTIGTDLRPQAMIKTESRNGRGVSEDQATAIGDKLEELWKEWEPYATVDGASALEEIKVGMRSFLVDGDGLFILSDIGAADKPLPLSLQAIDADRLESPAGNSNPLVRLGIEKDKIGRRLAYHFLERSPGDEMAGPGQHSKYERIDADRVLHLYDKLFADQTRGLPWCFSSVTRIKDCKDFVEAVLVAEQVAACFTAFVETEINPYDAASGSAVEEDTDGFRIEDLSPGRVEYLKKGQKVNFSNPARPGGSLGPFMEVQLRAIAAGLGIPYELLAMDYSRTNYSSGRLSLIDGREKFKAFHKMLVSRILQPIWRRFVRECVILDLVDLTPAQFNADPYAFTCCQWIHPGWPWIDPVKEVKADLDAVNGNLTTLQNTLAARGLDLEETLAQRGREIKLQQKYGCTPVLSPGAETPNAKAEDPQPEPAGVGKEDSDA